MVWRGLVVAQEVPDGAGGVRVLGEPGVAGAVDALQNGFAAAVAAVEGANVGATGVGDSDAVEVAVIAVGNITPGVFNGVVGAAGAV